MASPPFESPTAALAAEIWRDAFEEICQRMSPYFVQVQTRQRAQAYVRGLLSPVERKNGWQLAEEAGETTPYAMQYLLDRAVWDSEQLRDVLCRYVEEMLGESTAVLVIDETGFLKKGIKSVGVQRQYSGTAGRIENCQLGVFLTYASQAGHTLLDRELYLPKSWTQDTARCREAHVPTEVSFATKPELAARMLARTLDGGISAAWVTGDTVYGSHRPLRAVLEARQQAYALAVPRREHVQVQAESAPRRVDHVAGGLPAEAWQPLSAGSGSKGPRLFDWARVELVEASPARAGWQHWLVIRRSLTSGAHRAKMAYVLVFARTGTTLSDMVQAIGSRWTVEQCLEEAKGQVGLDEYEVRSWQGWYRHITLCLLAHAFLTVLRAHSQAELPLSDAHEEKKQEHSSQPHSPSRTLDAFKRTRGLTVR
jgi:SRSO17 transposase